MADHFGLGRVEGKQILPGKSGANWEIDAKGLASNGDGVVIVECRRYPKARLSQGAVAELAYRISDTGAKGGIIVSPLKPQRGAKKVANHAGIGQVQLTPESTTTSYVLQWLDKVFVGVSDTIQPLTDSVEAKKTTGACNKGDHTACVERSCACECHHWEA